MLGSVFMNMAIPGSEASPIFNAGGRDLRLQGLKHIEHALKGPILSRPLALKTLIWFYISEQINPDNASAEQGQPLSPGVCRKRALELLMEYESRYFKETAPDQFIGNKGYP